MAGLRLGILGGTFDPPHIGHLVMAECAREQLDLTRVVFMPAGDPWLKAERTVSPADHRLAMTKLAIDDHDGFVVDDREIRRSGPTYTVETLQALRDELTPGDEMFFLLGEDAIAELPRWKTPERIPKLAVLAVAPRLGGEAPIGISISPGRVIQIEMPYIGVSSTELRARVREGKSIRYQVPDAVERYIREHRLYR